MSFRDHIIEAGNALYRAVNAADTANTGRLARRLGMSGQELTDFATWAYNEIPAALAPLSYAALLLGEAPEAVRARFTEYADTPEGRILDRIEQPSVASMHPANYVYTQHMKMAPYVLIH